ncbi:MAG: cyclodeaminase/cyclohydrolase family protein [Oscillospiraceae bacterium]|nr:cyclodeaminase/cyclohydrolase family protein [Oscillospiraceae bacterium]
MNQLTEYSCTAFGQALASKASVPGGGGAAALAGALGVALCSMVGNFTTGKKKFVAVEDDVQRMLSEGEALRIRLLELVDTDALAFEPLSKAYSIPKDDPSRDEIMEEATINACRAPLEMISCCGKAMLLLQEMLEKGSKMLISDVGCGALLCKAAMESAALNVFVNTGTLNDRETAEKMEKQVDEALSTYLPMADKISAAVTAYIRKEA